MLRVNLGPRSYDIAVNHDGGIGAFVRERSSAVKACIVADDNVMPHAEAVAKSLHGVGILPTIASVSPGEASKSLAVAAKLYDALAALPAERSTPVIAVGGGVVGDLAGFVAATWHRGVPFVQMPTTLLAMVDSSVGGKVGVNHPSGKNLIGAFHQPLGVWIDTAFLATLPEREYRSGLAEVVKYGAIMDAEFFGWLEANANSIVSRDTQAVVQIVNRCCELKAQVVEADEREETGRRMILNYGHTFAHAFENVGGYGGWLHGEAVAAGMVCASRLAERLKMIGPVVTMRQVALLERFGLPTTPKPEWPAAVLLNAMLRDKKTAAGKLRLVLPARMGQVEIVGEVPAADVVAVLQK